MWYTLDEISGTEGQRRSNAVGADVLGGPRGGTCVFSLRPGACVCPSGPAGTSGRPSPTPRIAPVFVSWRGSASFPPPPGAGEGRPGFPQPPPFLAWRASPQAGVAIRFLLRLFCVFAGSDLPRAKPISLFVLPKRETAFDVKEKRALVGKGEPRGGRGVAACGRTIRGAPAVRSAAARPGPVRFLPARPLRLGSVAARLLPHVILSIRVILSVSEESPGQNVIPPDGGILRLRGLRPLRSG